MLYPPRRGGARALGSAQDDSESGLAILEIAERYYVHLLKKKVRPRHSRESEK
jgi:hypothetical protein